MSTPSKMIMNCVVSIDTERIDADRASPTTLTEMSERRCAGDAINPKKRQTFTPACGLLRHGQ